MNNKKQDLLVAYSVTVIVFALLFSTNYDTIKSIISRGINQLAAVVTAPVTVTEPKDTDAHPIRPYPYVGIHQYDDLFNGRDIDTGRKDFVPDYDSISNITINKSMTWTEFLKTHKPISDDIVKIPSGVTVTYDYNAGSESGFKGIALNGTLIFSPNIDTKLIVGTIIVGVGGKITMKPQGDHTQEIVFKGNIDKTKDPYQMTLGLITMGEIKSNSGSMNMSGTPTIIDIEGRRINTPFVRLSGPMQGNTLTFEGNSALDWRVGDEIYLHGDNKKDVVWSTPLPFGGSKKIDEIGGYATVKITGIRNNTITINKSRSELGFEPVNFVPNVTRTVILRSHPDTDRAHTMFNSNTQLSIKYAAFIDMGRTSTEPLQNAKMVSGKVVPGPNQVGRYVVHLHHLQNGYIVEGNVVRGERIEEIWQNPSHRVPNASATLTYAGGERVLINKYTELKAVKADLNFLIVPKTDEIKIHSASGKYLALDANHGMTTNGLNFVDYSVDGSGAINANGKKVGFINKPFVQNGRVLVFDPIKNSNIDTGWQVKRLPIASPKWAIVSHNSFGKTLNNVVVGAEGAGIVGEEGLETGTVSGNLVVGMGGGNGDKKEDIRWDRTKFKSFDFGYAGFGYWFNGGLSDISNNKADGFFRNNSYSIHGVFFLDILPTEPSGLRRTPNISGMPDELRNKKVNPAFTVWKFDNNESTADIETNTASGEIGYSLSLSGIWSQLTQVGPQSETEHTVEINGYKSIKHGIQDEGSREIIYKDLDLRGAGKGIGFNHYVWQAFIKGGTIEGFEYAVKLPIISGFSVQDTVLKNNKHEYLFPNLIGNYGFYNLKVQSTSEREKLRKELDEKARADAKKKDVKADAIAYVSSFNGDIPRFNHFSDKAYGWVALSLLNDKDKTVNIKWDIQEFPHQTLLDKKEKDYTKRYNTISGIELGMIVPSNYAPLRDQPMNSFPKILNLCTIRVIENKGESSRTECRIANTPELYNMIKPAIEQNKLIIRVFNEIYQFDYVISYPQLRGVLEKVNGVVPVQVPPNLPPTVSISSVPASTANITAPATIELTADAKDQDEATGGSIAKVEFYNGSSLVSTKTSSPYKYSVSSLVAGKYTFKAVATDNVGSSTESALLSITVNAQGVQPSPSSSPTPTTPPTNPGTGKGSILKTNLRSDQYYSTVSKVIVYLSNPDKVPLVSEDFLIGNYAVKNFTVYSNEIISFNMPADLKSGTYNITWFEGGRGAHTLPIKVVNTASTQIAPQIPVNPVTPATPTSTVNKPPTVTLKNTTDITNLIAPATVVLEATASDPDGNITTLSFFKGDQNMYSRISGPYIYTAKDLPAGTYVFKAIVVDNAKATNSTVTSNLITVKVNPPAASSLPATNTLTNVPPTADATLIIGSSNLVAPATVTIRVQAFDSDGSVSKVEYYKNDALIYTQPSTGPLTIYSYAVTGLTAGKYTLKARSMDNKGAYSPFSSKDVVVNATAVPNKPPTVTISTPTNITSLEEPATIQLDAVASDSDGSIARVDYYNSFASVGSDTTAPYSIKVEKLLAGTYNFRVRALDNLGGFSESYLPTITVKKSSAPNKAPIVSNPSVTMLTSNRVQLKVTATDTDGIVKWVEFWDGTNRVGAVSVGNLSVYGSTNVYEITASNLTVGTHNFRAKAIDNAGVYTEIAFPSVVIK